MFNPDIVAINNIAHVLGLKQHFLRNNQSRMGIGFNA
jgi:hypothetical protein